jgi:hypothetical protein
MDSVSLAKKLRGWQEEHPKTDLALGFVPGVGQAYGLASSAAAMADPDASTLEKALAVGSVLPLGKAGQAVRKIVIGKRGAYADELKTLEKAIRKHGTDNSDAVFKDTGWWREGGDGKWQKEVSDEDFHFDARRAQKEAEDLGGETEFLAKDIMHHPQLIPRYQTSVGAMPVNVNQTVGGKYHPDVKEIEVGLGGRGKYSPEEVALHENVHRVQDVEGFAGRGTNSEAAGSVRGYLEDPGEMSARLTQIRRDWTDAERSAYPMKDMMKDENHRLQSWYAANATDPPAFMTTRRDGVNTLPDYVKRRGISQKDLDLEKIAKRTAARLRGL